MTKRTKKELLEIIRGLDKASYLIQAVSGRTGESEARIQRMLREEDIPTILRAIEDATFLTIELRRSGALR